MVAGRADEPTGLKIVAQIFTRDRGDYYALAEDVEQHPGPLPASVRDSGAVIVAWRRGAPGRYSSSAA